MVPPPSQAGRFKPRKPAKKIRVGGGSISSTTTASATTEPSPAPASSRTTTSRAGRGRGGRGRGGSRAPTPHGDVFFTGNAPPPTAASSTTTRSSSTTAKLPAVSSGSTSTTNRSSSKTKDKTRKTQTTTEEIIIGELDVAIGTSSDETKAVKLKVEEQVVEEEMDTERVEQERKKPASKVEIMADTYDSDSSEETEQNRFSTSVPPTELPFPVATLPVGVAGHERPVLYDCQRPQDSKSDKEEPLVMELQRDQPLVSPFVDERRWREEDDSWFLFQLPTRLPPLVASPEPEKSDEIMADAALSSDAVVETPDVVTPSTITTHFDNALSQAPAGRLGKIVVYKSGKTVLRMGGDDGTPEILMNVTEGLPCGFVQQAVAIDTEAGTYTPLGEVKKTVVVTPDVELAFSSS